MPVHDWTKVGAGTYHNFHYRWITSIMDQLNSGILPSGYLPWPSKSSVVRNRRWSL